jgi:hypothetical protein
MWMAIDNTILAYHQKQNVVYSLYTRLSVRHVTGSQKMIADGLSRAQSQVYRGRIASIQV